MNDLTQKLLIGILTPLALATLYWLGRRVNQKFIKPLTEVAELNKGFATLTNDVALIKKEVQSNSGQSLKDLCASTSDTVSVLDARQRGLMATLASAMFEADPNFNWTEGNISLERLTGYGFSRLAHKGWISRIHDDDRNDVMREIAFAVADKRTAAISFRMVTSSDVIVPVRLDASPVFAKSPPDKVLCWSGLLTKESEDRRTIDERRHGS